MKLLKPQAELVCFQNAKLYREYAVRFRKTIFHRWQYVLNDSGVNALNTFAEANKLLTKVKSGKA